MKIKIAVLAVSLLAIASQAKAQRYGCDQSSTPSKVTINRYYYYPPSNITHWDYSNPCHTQYRISNEKLTLFGVKTFIPISMFQNARPTYIKQPYRHVIIYR